MRKFHWLAISAIVWIFLSAVTTTAQENTTTFDIAPKIGPCIVFAPAGIGYVNLVNSCGECRTAVMSWCDGNIRHERVPGYGSKKIATCIGSVTLATDIPCGSAYIDDYGQLGSFTQGLAPTGSSCSAKNDVGDTCSISCETGQAAHCSNASGAGSPTCECK
jgi:hypothetical protein